MPRKRNVPEMSTDVLHIRVTPTEHSMLQARADLGGVPLVDYIRDRALALDGLPNYTTEQIIAELYRRQYTVLLGGEATRQWQYEQMEKMLAEMREREAKP